MSSHSSRVSYSEKTFRRTLSNREAESWCYIQERLIENLKSINYRFLIREERKRDSIITREHRLRKKLHRNHLRKLDLTEKQYKKAVKLIETLHLVGAKPIIVAKKTKIIEEEGNSRVSVVKDEDLLFNIIHEDHLRSLGITWKTLKRAREICSQYRSLCIGSMKPIQFILLRNTICDEDSIRRRITHEEITSRSSLKLRESKSNHYVFFERERDSRRSVEEGESSMFLAEIRYQARLHAGVVRRDMARMEDSLRRNIVKTSEVNIHETLLRGRVMKDEICNWKILITGHPLSERTASWIRRGKFNADVIFHILEFIHDDMPSIKFVLQGVFMINQIPTSLSRAYGFSMGIPFSILEKYQSLQESSVMTARQTKKLYQITPIGPLRTVTRRYLEREVFVYMVNLYASTKDDKLKKRLLKHHSFLNCFQTLPSPNVC